MNFENKGGLACSYLYCSYLTLFSVKALPEEALLIKQGPPSMPKDKTELV